MHFFFPFSAVIGAHFQQRLAQRPAGIGAIAEHSSTGKLSRGTYSK